MEGAPTTRESYYQRYGSSFHHLESEKLFVDEFLWPLLGPHISKVVPQRPFIDSSGRCRKIDFSFVDGARRLALEVNGETYHAEGVIPNELFDDNLFRQNEILRGGYRLIRFSYQMLQSPKWRPVVAESLRRFFAEHAPELLGEDSVNPNPLQIRALKDLDFYRTTKNYRKGVVILPTGTGKTILSALDAKRFGGRVLFLVHRLDILKQSIEAYQFAWPTVKVGVLTGEQRENVENSEVLFASKDTLRQPNVLSSFERDEFDYMVVDEVHHGQTPTYREVLEYFNPKFMLGMTATPDRLDRRDILELFDYNKVLEVSLQEAIEDGHLVPYTYFGLVDDVDYSRIRLHNNRYRVDDLDRLLIIPERNEAILREYLSEEKGAGDKAIGFCCSIRHAKRMADYFTEKGIPAAAITSETPDRDARIAAFRQNQIQVAFTVDLFNEGVDFPNVRVLMFLRPTESKTVFVQQLGRGLRLCIGKDRVRVLDFIGNYRRANQVRKWLAKSLTETSKNEGGIRVKKVEYTYSNGCEVKFDTTVEEILDRQDAAELEVTKDDLEQAYFMLAERIGRKPSQDDLNREGQYKAVFYTRAFGTWLKFLQAIGEYTEASYHYPQGVHLGHLLSILKVVGSGDRAGTHLSDEYIRMRGRYDEDRIGAYQRQVKYKLQAAMELGIIFDDRGQAQTDHYAPELTAKGIELYGALNSLLESLNLDFRTGADALPSTAMELRDRDYNARLAAFLETSGSARELFLSIFLKMPAVSQMASYLYQIERLRVVRRQNIYQSFFKTPFVREFCDREGIAEATDEAAKHRCPFLLNVLEACGLVSQSRDEITIHKFLIAAPVLRSHGREAMEAAEMRARVVRDAWPTDENALPGEDLSMLRELFGPAFLTDRYHLAEAEYVQLF